MMSWIFRFFLLFFLLFCFKALSKDVAVMLLVDGAKEGNHLYDKYLKDLGFKRYPRAYKTDYHVSLGYIDEVEDEELDELKKYIKDNLISDLKEGVDFEYGSSIILGKRSNYIVAIPKKVDELIKLNKKLFELISSFKHGKYKLSKYSRPGGYIPHLSLNGIIYKDISIQNLYDVLDKLNKRLDNYHIKLKDLVIN